MVCVYKWKEGRIKMRKEFKAFSSVAISGIILIMVLITFNIVSTKTYFKEKNEVRYYGLEQVVNEQEKLYSLGEEWQMIYCNGYVDNSIETNLEILKIACKRFLQ